MNASVDIVVVVIIIDGVGYRVMTVSAVVPGVVSIVGVEVESVVALVRRRGEVVEFQEQRIALEMPNLRVIKKVSQESLQSRPPLLNDTGPLVVEELVDVVEGLDDASSTFWEPKVGDAERDVLV